MLTHRVRVLAVLGVMAVVAVLATALASSTAASESQLLTLETSKAPGPVAGTFTAAGAFSDSGAINNVGFIFSGIGAPTFVVTHPTILFTGDDGTFTVKAQIRETAGDDPHVLVNTGTWSIIAGTGAYERLRGQGTLTGTNDDILINRTYVGEVHFD